MERITVASDHEHFLRGGTPFFWVGDTVWSAFTNATEEEWREYLTFRAALGFNVVQINTLPQWDRIRPDLGLYPYPLREDGSLDVSAAPNPAYWERARRLCRMANDFGFTPALVLDWANIVPGTWLARLFPGHVWPWEAVERHIRSAVETFEDFAPVYLVSGDTDLSAQEAVGTYQRSIELLKTLAPDSLRTMHLCGGYLELTEELADGLDFYMYQSGHEESSAARLETMPAELRRRFPGKPVLNAEPCYERMPRLSGDWNRPPEASYTAEEVLDACRRSIAAGADAGITYGANGLWNWCREDGVPEGLAAKLYGRTATWREAMRFPGAAEIAGLKRFAYPSGR